jgi:hypothetical protein
MPSSFHYPNSRRCSQHWQLDPSARRGCRSRLSPRPKTAQPHESRRFKSPTLRDTTFVALEITSLGANPPEANPRARNVRKIGVGPPDEFDILEADAYATGLMLMNECGDQRCGALALARLNTIAIERRDFAAARGLLQRG